MIARAEHVIDLLLFDVGVPAVEPDLPSPLIEFPAALDGFEVRVRCLMEDTVRRFTISAMFSRRRTVKRAAHSGFRESGGDALVALEQTAGST